MRIGVPKETHAHERRIALTPSGVRTLAQEGHELYVESGAGVEAGHADSLYEAAGARIVFDRMEILLRPELLCCVHPPRPDEFRLLPANQTIFAFWGLPAAHPEDIAQLLSSGITAVGLEAIEDARGNAPILTSMSEIAGGLAVVFGAGALLNTGRGQGGRGILLGGAPGSASGALRGARRRCSRDERGAHRDGSRCPGLDARRHDRTAAPRPRGARSGTDHDAGDPAQHREGDRLRRRACSALRRCMGNARRCSSGARCWR